MILYREAVAMGLDRDDTVIRRRLAQKLEFLSQDLISPQPPTQEELQAYFKAHMDRYQTPDLITMTHVFFDPDKRGDQTLEDAEAIKLKLQALKTPPRDAHDYGDPFMLQSYYPERSEAELLKLFGSGFAQSVFELSPQQWHGPVLSGCGTHLVYVHDRREAEPPTFAEAEAQVRQEWESDKREELNEQFVASMIAAIMVGVAGNQLYIDKIKYHELMLSDGITFLLFFAIFMNYIYKEAASGAAHQYAAGAGRAGSEDEPDEIKTLSPLKSIVFIVFGLAGLVFGGEFIVDGASGVAKNFGLSNRVIGLLIVGPGTSVPELIASIVAARKGSADMVVGNVLGSNIFNILFMLGATALIRPVPLDLALNVVILVNIAVTFFLVMFAWFSRKKLMGRGIGGFLVASYVAYIVYALMF